MSIDPKFVELTADVLEIFVSNKIEGLLQTQATLGGGFYSRQVPRRSLTCTR